MLLQTRHSTAGFCSNENRAETGTDKVTFLRYEILYHMKTWSLINMVMIAII